MIDGNSLVAREIARYVIAAVVVGVLLVIGAVALLHIIDMILG